MSETLKIKNRNIENTERVNLFIEYDQKSCDKIFSDLYLTLNEDSETGESEKEIFIQLSKEECNINGIRVSDRQRKAIIQFLTSID